MRSYSPNDEPIPGYRLIDQLGQGSFGVVWKAEGPGGVLVALKIISNLNGIHAIREWQSLQNVMNLKQANLVEIYGVWLKNEEGKVLRADEVRALIPADVDVAAPVTETSAVPPLARKRSVWSGDQRSSKSGRPTHLLQGATLQPDEEPPTESQAGSTDAATDGERTDSDPPEGAGGQPVQALAGSSRDSQGSQGKWSKAAGVPPLELVSAMTLGEGTLMSRLKQCQSQGQKGIPRPELLQYMREAAKGLQYLNDRAMHHCDVKPENLLLVGGSVKVCDYGSALRTIYSAESRTHQGYTEQYAAPEQLSGRRVKLHAATDLYALALTYYALRTGKYPWGDSASEPIAVLKYSEKFDFSAMAKLSRYPYEWQVIRRALKRDPGERFASTAEFFEMLERAVHREEEATRARRRRKIRNAVLMGVAACLVGLGVAGWFYQDKLGLNIGTVSPQQRFNILVTSDDPAEMKQAIQLIHKSPGEIEPNQVVDRIALRLKSLQFDVRKPQVQSALQSLLQDILTLKPPYRQGLTDPVQAAATELFSRKFAASIEEHDYRSVMIAVEGLSGLREWGLLEAVQGSLIDRWQQEALATLASADHDSAAVADAIAPVAALAAAAADDPKRLAEIDESVITLLQTSADEAGRLLGDLQGLRNAEREYAWLAAVAKRYAQSRPENDAKLRALAGEGAIGVVAARYRGRQESAQRLEADLSEIALEDVAARPLALARLLLLRRDLSRNEEALVSSTFLQDELPKLNSLRSEWERQVLAGIKSRAKDVALERAQNGSLPNLDEILTALADDRLLLLSVKNALASSRAASSDIVRAIDDARKLLSTAELEDQGDQRARAALECWLTLTETDAPSAAQVATCLTAFDVWATEAPQDGRTDSWFKDFAIHMAVRSQRWPKEVLNAAISDLENAPDRQSMLDHRPVDLALRSQRMLKMAVDGKLTTKELSLLEQDSLRLLQARAVENVGDVASNFVTPGVLVDALWAESQLAPLVLKPANVPPAAELRSAVDRVSQHLAVQERAPAADAGPLSYLQYVVDLHRALAGKTIQDDLTNILRPPPSGDIWLEPPLRHQVAATVLLNLAGELPELPGDANYTRFRNANAARQRELFHRSGQWAVPGSREDVVADARVALLLRYGAENPDWEQILAVSTAATAAPNWSATVTDEQELCHLLLVHAEALEKSNADQTGRVVEAFADVLRRVCDPYGKAGYIADAALFARAVKPAADLIGDKTPSELQAAPEAVATVLGSLGALLERDSLREIANPHYAFDKSPDRYFDAMVSAYRRAGSLETDSLLRRRWLAGEALAMDAQAEMALNRNPGDGTQSDFEPLCKELERIAEQLRRGDEEEHSFLLPGIAGLVASYRAQDANDSGRPAEEQQFCQEAYDNLQAALRALPKHPQAGSPWCAYWQAAFSMTLSQICLQQSWDMPWGVAHQQKMLEAIAHGKEAASAAAGDIAQARGLMALGNAYEDYALHLLCTPFFQKAEETFTEAQSKATADAYLRLRAAGELQRVRMRRPSYDPTVEPLAGAAYQQLISDVELLRDAMNARDMHWSSQNLAFWQAETYRKVNTSDAKARAEAYAKAEQIFADLAKNASGEKRAKRLRAAADCALDRAKAAASDDLIAPQALASAEGHLKELQEEYLVTAEDRARAIKLRLDVWAFGTKSKDERFVKLWELTAETLKNTEKMPPAEAAKLQFDLHRTLADAAVLTQKYTGQAREMLDVCQDVLKRARQDSLWSAEDLARREIETLSAEGLLRWRAATADRQESAWAVFGLLKQAIEAADRLEKEMGTINCCESEGEPAEYDARGYWAAAETLDERRFCVSQLMDLLHKRGTAARERNDAKVHQAVLAELKWIKAMLQSTKERLPKTPQCEEFKGHITATYLSEVQRLIDNL